MFLINADKHRVALGVSRADTANTPASASSPELVAQRHQYPGAGGADGVAVGYRAAVDVYFLNISSFVMPRMGAAHQRHRGNASLTS